MNDKLLRLVKSMELEEKILHVGVLVSGVSLFFPWIGGQWYGMLQQWSGFGFYTGYIGHAVLLIEIFILVLTLSPMLGGPIFVRKSKRNGMRLKLCALCTMLLVAAFTILLRLTSEISGAEIRFGIYTSIIGSAIATLYAFLKYQEEIKAQAQALFQHPDETVLKPKPKPAGIFPEDKPPLPPPPPPMPPEDHHLFSNP